MYKQYCSKIRDRALMQSNEREVPINGPILGKYFTKRMEPLASHAQFSDPTHGCIFPRQFLQLPYYCPQPYSFLVKALSI